MSAFGIETLKLQQRKSAAFMGGICEGKDHCLTLVARDRFGRGHLTAIARADQAIEVAAHNRPLHGMIGSDQSLGSRKIFGRPMIQIGADAQRTLHGTEHAISEGSGSGS